MQKRIEFFLVFDRVYRILMAHMKFILEKLHVNNISPIQAVMLYNIGSAHTAVMIGDLTRYFYYLGSNPGYNVRKLINNGYLIYSKSAYDNRIYYVGLSPTGIKLFQDMKEQFIQKDQLIAKEKLDNLNCLLKNLERNLPFQ